MTKTGQKGQFSSTINPLQQINENELKDKATRKDKLKPLTRVVIRKLPPTMTEETFLKQIEPLPDYESYYFVPADWSLGQNSTSRAYISFINHSDIFSFKDRFDGYVFIDNRTGSEYPAIVEFAPFQGLLKPKCRKNDPKCNTIESDPCYVSFLEKCQNEIKKSPSTIDFKLEFSTSHRNDKKYITTPLLQYLANKKQEKKEERKRRQDQKRRQQDEERKRKRGLPVKSLPPTITEEEYKDNKKDKDKNFNKKNKERYMPTDNKNDFIARRKLERDQNKRQEQQERNFSDNRNKKQQQQQQQQQQDQGISCAKNIKILNSMSKINENDNFKENSNSNLNINECTVNLSSLGRNINSNVNKKTNSQNEVNENVRKFIMNASSIIQINNESKSVTSSPSSSIPSNKCEKSSKKANTSDFSKSSSHGKNDDKQRKDEKTSRRIRNKDRPSIEIYQPGKMRLNSNKNDNRSNKSGSDDGKCNNDNTGKETINIYDNSNIDDTDITKPIGKKVSRYSERRLNHAKEREEYAKKLNLELKNLSEQSLDQAIHP